VGAKVEFNDKLLCLLKFISHAKAWIFLPRLVVITQPGSPDSTAFVIPDLSFTHDMIAGHLLVLEPFSNTGRWCREVMRVSPDSAGVERYQIDGSITLNLYSILPDGRLKLSFLFPRGAVEHIRLQCQTGVNTFFVIYHGFFAVDGAVYKLSIF